MFLKYILLFILFTICSNFAFSGQAFRGDGVVRIFNYHLNEFAEVHFRQGEQLLPKGLKAANHLLRSRDNSETIPIDTRLLDLIDHLQDHFGADQIEIISGYRRKELNAALLKEGRGVSPVSLHMQGKALDIHIDEIREETLRDYLVKLRQGGVGYYGPMDFVHIDFGRVHQWGGRGPFPRKLVGVLNKEAPVQLTSDKNDYLPGETLHFAWTFMTLGPLTAPGRLRPGTRLRVAEEVLGGVSRKGLQLEHFGRGKWHSVPLPEIKRVDDKMSVPAAALRKPDGSIRFGKYRWLFKLEGSDDTLSSNEFYLKKQ